MDYRSHAGVFLLMLAAAVSVAAGPDREWKDGLDQAGFSGGLAIHIGSTDGQVELELSRGGRILVHGVTLDGDACQTARRAIAASGLYGAVSVERLGSFQRLPYADHLVNAVVADLDRLGQAAPAEEEILRVLAPCGVACLKRDGRWTNVVKPLPKEMDQWQHWDHGPDGNPASLDQWVGPTTSLRWYAGPTTTDNAADKVGLRLAGGRVFYLMRNYELASRNRRGTKADVVARDAFNGVLLWKQPFADVPGRGDDPARFALTAVDDRVYTFLDVDSPLQSLDAQTGQPLLTYESGPVLPAYKDRRYWDSAAEEMHLIVRVFDGRLLQVHDDTAYLLDERTGRQLWTFREGADVRLGWAVAAEGKVFITLGKRPLAKFRSSPACPVDEVVALDLQTGKPVWRNAEFARDSFVFRMIWHRGRVVVPHFPLPGGEVKGSSYANNYTVCALAAADGQTLWKNDESRRTAGHYQVIAASGDRIYVGNQGGFSLDLESGRFLAQHDWGQYDAGCADLRCIPGFACYGLTFIDDQNAKVTRGQARSRCDTGVFPGYGMMYAGPSGCLCSNFINGYLALAPEAAPQPVADSQRLETANSRQSSAPDGPWPRPDEWPIHMADPRRGCSSQVSVGEDLQVTWKTTVASPVDSPLARDWKDNDQLPGALTAPTVAGGSVFVADVEAHRLAALDAETGRLRWSFTTGGRIDSPPTIYDGLCLLGCRDGYVYCLDAEWGHLIWRFLAATAEKRIGVQSQLESAWPVPGSIMIHNGHAVFTAGRQSAVDGGIQVYAVEPSTGQLLWKTRIWTDPDADRDTEPRSNRYQPDYRRIQCLLVSNGRDLFHAIDRLKPQYDADELVALLPRTAADRGGWITDRRSEPSARDITALWPNSNGFLSKRSEGVGRNDIAGVAYSNLWGEKIVLADDRLYLLSHTGYGRKHPGLSEFALDAAGLPAESPRWNVKVDTGQYHFEAMVLAGDRLLLAGHKRYTEEAVLQVFTSSDGARLDEIALPARPVRDGLAVAYGHVFIAGADGDVYCVLTP